VISDGLRDHSLVDSELSFHEGACQTKASRTCPVSPFTRTQTETALIGSTLRRMAGFGQPRVFVLSVLAPAASIVSYGLLNSVATLARFIVLILNLVAAARFQGSEGYANNVLTEL